MKYNSILHIICILCILIPQALMYKIYISPGGLRGFYTYGICKFLKEKYDMSNYHFYGASAGAWNSLHMSLKQEYEPKFTEIMNEMEPQHHSLHAMQERLKEKLLKNFDENHFRIHETIYEDFNDLEDAISCCMASSHIPIISGKTTYRYKDKYCIDGGIYGFKEQKDTPNLVVFPEMFDFDFSRHDDINTFQPHKLIVNGYEDAFKHRKKIDHYLTQK